jgi:hypothetical protein
MSLFIDNFSWSLKINVSCWNCVLVCTLQSDKIFSNLSQGHEFIKLCTKLQITILRSSNVCSLNLMCNQCFFFSFLSSCNMQLIIMYKIGSKFYNFYGLWMQFNLRLLFKVLSALCNLYCCYMHNLVVLIYYVHALLITYFYHWWWFVIKPSKLLPNFQMKFLFTNHNVNNNVEIVGDQSSMVSSCNTPQCPSLAKPITFGLLINLSSYLTQISFDLSKFPPNKSQKNYKTIWKWQDASSFFL